MLDDDHIHDGHRARMRAKLIAHGPRIFDTYELLEMLLYYVVPQRDTNPIAKRLLHRFGSLDGVLRAERDDLLTVSGVGEYVADFIISVGRASDLTAASDRRAPLIFDDYNKAGKYLVEYFAENPDTNIVILLLDNTMRMLGTENIPGTNFGSEVMMVRPEPDWGSSSRARSCR